MIDDNLSNNCGWVYILENPAINVNNKPLLKIGRTKNSPEYRADILSGDTSVPIDFEVKHAVFVHDRVAAEKLIHGLLGKRNQRYNEFREFFTTDAVDAINAIENIKSYLISKIFDPSEWSLSDFNEKFPDPYSATNIRSGFNLLDKNHVNLNLSTTEYQLYKSLYVRYLSNYATGIFRDDIHEELCISHEEIDQHIKVASKFDSNRADYKKTKSILSNDADMLLAEIAKYQAGFVSSAQAEDAGLDRRAIWRRVSRGFLDRAMRGVYFLSYFPEPDPAIAQSVIYSIWSHDKDFNPQAALSHASALDYYGVSDATPKKVDLTAPRLFSYQIKVPQVVQLHRADLEKNEIIEHAQGFNITSAARTLIDVLMDKTFDCEHVKQALVELVESGKLNVASFLNEVSLTIEERSLWLGFLDKVDFTTWSEEYCLDSFREKDVTYSLVMLRDICETLEASKASPPQRGRPKKDADNAMET